MPWCMKLFGRLGFWPQCHTHTYVLVYAWNWELRICVSNWGTCFPMLFSSVFNIFIDTKIILHKFFTLANVVNYIILVTNNKHCNSIRSYPNTTDCIILTFRNVLLLTWETRLIICISDIALRIPSGTSCLVCMDRIGVCKYEDWWTFDWNSELLWKLIFRYNRGISCPKQL